MTEKPALRTLTRCHVFPTPDEAAASDVPYALARPCALGAGHQTPEHFDGEHAWTSLRRPTTDETVAQLLDDLTPMPVTRTTAPSREHITCRHNEEQLRRAQRDALDRALSRAWAWELIHLAAGLIAGAVITLGVLGRLT